MAKTKVKFSKDEAKGESVSDPTRASKPAEPTYKFPLSKGLPSIADKGAPLTGYGRNAYAGPSSVGVKDSADMTDQRNLATPTNDPVLDLLKSGGFGDRSESGTPIADLERKIDTTGYPTHPAMSKRGVDDGSPGGKI
jgi:hypothetical protein